MPELRLQVPQSVIDDINAKLRKINGNEAFSISLTDIGREAMTYYKWAVDQTDDGRAVVATDQSKKDLVQLGTPALPARKPTR